MKYTRKQVTVRALEAAARAYERCAQWVRSASPSAQQRIEEEVSEAARRTGPPLGSAVLAEARKRKELIYFYATRKD